MPTGRRTGDDSGEHEDDDVVAVLQHRLARADTALRVAYAVGMLMERMRVTPAIARAVLEEAAARAGEPVEQAADRLTATGAIAVPRGADDGWLLPPPR